MKIRWMIGAAALTAATHAAEPPVRDGLVLWLDASSQRPARQAASVPPLGNGQPVDILLDQSGRGRQALQHSPERRPKFISDGTTALLAFDGKDDFLAVSGMRQLAPAITVFLSSRRRKRIPGISPLFSGRRRLGKTIIPAG